MSIKYFKNFFIVTIIFLTIVGIYIVYIKDSNNKSGVQAKNKEAIISKEIYIGITEFDTINPILTKSLEIRANNKISI